MLQIQLVSTPSQALSVQLGGQQCQISVYQKSTGMFLDLSVNNAPIITAKLCRNRTKLVRHRYLGFLGDLAIVDTQGNSDPEYKGLGERYVLIYVAAGEV